MPAYNNQTPPPALGTSYPNNQCLVFNAEAVKSGEYSQQVSIPPSPTGAPYRGLRIILDFSAAPGTFEFDVLEDDIDTAGAAHYSAIPTDRKSTRLNSSHLGISYAVFCLKK